MAVLYDMAQMTVSSTGTGTITLLGAAVADGVTYLTFAQAGIANGDIVSYRIKDTAGAWEIGRGTYTAAGTTLTRGMLKSSTGSAISITSSAMVSIVPLGEDFSDLRVLIGLGAPSVSWLAGANPNNAVLIVANRALIITGIRAVIRVANGTATSVNILNGAGTAINSTGFDFSQAVGAYTITQSATTTLASGDYLYLSTASTFALSVGNITVFVN